MTDIPDLDHLDLRPLPGSERPPARGFAAPRAVPADTIITITVILRRQAEVPDEVLSNPITPQEFGTRYGASAADLDLVTQTLSGLGAQIVEVDGPGRRIRLSGTVGLLSKIFGADLSRATSIAPSGAEVEHRHRTGGLSVPAALDGVITGVLGLDDRPQTRAQYRLAQPQPPYQAAQAQAAQAQAAQPHFIPGGYAVPDLATIYQFPPDTDGTGQTIAIVELGGGYLQADLDAFFAGLSLPTPSITAVGVDGAANVGGQDPHGFDGEVLLDIEVAGALAPKANLVVYFAPNTDAGFVDALSQAAHAEPAPIAISISWGANEDDWTPQGRAAVDAALIDACALGVTVTVAAGDDGSTDRATDGRAHADFPAASPHALACGGTSLSADPVNGTINSETVWNNGPGKGAGGGGVSDTFELPSWQGNVGVPSIDGKTGRGVPDVAAVADPQTGYRVRVDGKDLTMGGTSAVAPLWAALIARLGQATGRRFGLIQPALYGAAAAGAVAPGFRDITDGSIGAYQASSGWDACTGLGVPIGTQLLAALQSASSGDGGTPPPTAPGNTGGSAMS